jgi:NADPH-dependent 2,4-dienoyl-CoA reductase/sulfur reductase-like enzyme
VTPEAMKEKYNVDVRVQNEVVSIDRENKTVTCKTRAFRRGIHGSYDTLVISTALRRFARRFPASTRPDPHALDGAGHRQPP